MFLNINTTALNDRLFW